MDVKGLLTSLGGITPVGDSFVPMPLSDIEEVESVCNGRLPTTYRNILLMYGAFVFEKELYFPAKKLLHPAREARPSGLNIAAFYGAKSSDYDETHTVLWNYEEYKSAVGDEFVPFADNGGDDIYFTDTSFLTNGRVIAWHLGDNNTFPVARDFDVFLSALVAE